MTRTYSLLSALGDICQSDAPDEESFTRVANFYNMDGEILEAEHVLQVLSSSQFHRQYCF